MKVLYSEGYRSITAPGVVIAPDEVRRHTGANPYTYYRLWWVPTGGGTPQSGEQSCLCRLGVHHIFFLATPED